MNNETEVLHDITKQIHVAAGRIYPKADRDGSISKRGFRQKLGTSRIFFITGRNRVSSSGSQTSQGKITPKTEEAQTIVARTHVVPLNADAINV
jgi:hypothetical protein